MSYVATDYPVPAAYPQNEMLCVLECQAGLCKDDAKCKIHCHAVVGDWLNVQSAVRPVTSCHPVGNAEQAAKILGQLHADHVAKVETATAINWVALAQQVFQMLLLILSTLNPTPGK